MYVLWGPLLAHQKSGQVLKWSFIVAVNVVEALQDFWQNETIERDQSEKWDPFQLPIFNENYLYLQIWPPLAASLLILWLLEVV